MMAKQDTQQGFTLIEVLVALVLMALVSLISWRALETVRYTGERLDDRAEEPLSLMRVLGQIQRDILLHGREDILTGAATPGYNGQAQAHALIPTGTVCPANTVLGLRRHSGRGSDTPSPWRFKDSEQSQ